MLHRYRWRHASTAATPMQQVAPCILFTRYQHVLPLLYPREIAAKYMSLTYVTSRFGLACFDMVYLCGWVECLTSCIRSPRRYFFSYKYFPCICMVISVRKDSKRYVFVEDIYMHTIIILCTSIKYC